jgi:hypothetical protein
METLIKRSFFVLAATLAMTTLRAQTADDIVNKHVTALGGKDVVGGVKSLIIEGTMSAAGNDAPMTMTKVMGKGYKSVSDFGGTTLITTVTPTGGWMVNPYAGATTPTALPADQFKSQKINLYVDPLYDYATNGYKIELDGKDSADVKLKMTGEGMDATYYINANTYLIDKVVSKANVGGQEGEITISFSDYRKLDGGMMYPFNTTLDLPQISLSIVPKKVTVNPTVDPTIFDMPKQ